MSMILHKGARYVDRQQLAKVPVPEAVGRYMPVRHHEVAEWVQNALESHNFEVTGEKHGLSANGAKYFGYYELTALTGYSAVVGFRSSYDKTLAIKVALGSRVFICDNLALSGDIAVFRKHTTNVVADFHTRLLEAVELLPFLINKQDADFRAWRERAITPSQTDSLIASLYRANIVTRSQLPELFDEFKIQSADHGAPTLWRLFNATTEVMKSDTVTGALVNLPARTQHLHRFINTIEAEFQELT